MDEQNQTSAGPPEGPEQVATPPAGEPVGAPEATASSEGTGPQQLAYAPRRIRPRRWVVALTGAVTVLASIGAWAALRDTAQRLDAPRPSSAAEAPDFDPGLASAFSPGPEIGDLDDVLGRASSVSERSDPQGADTTTATSGSSSGAGSVTSAEDDHQVRRFSGSGGFESSQQAGNPDSGSGGGPSQPSRPGSRPSDGSELCDMPTFC